MQISLSNFLLLLFLGVNPTVPAPIAAPTPVITPEPLVIEEPAEPQEKPPQIIPIEENDPILGDSEAPITIIEYTDYECPFCAQLNEKTFPKIKENYIETGKAKYIVRNFPLDFHTNSRTGAQAAKCAQRQNKFWEMKDLLLSEQGRWTQTTDTPTELIKMAQEINITNIPAFSSCLEDKEIQKIIEDNIESGYNYGVMGTPTIYINGIQVTGAHPYVKFESIIESELEKSIK